MTEGVDEIVRRLDTLVRLVAMAICAERPQKERIKILAGAGLPPKEIAALLGTTPNTVSVTLSSMRRTTNSKKKNAVREVKGPMPPDLAAEE
jgi:DNA-binding CsgD family transcriptional regulator